MAQAVRFKFKSVRNGKTITLRHDSILTSAPYSGDDGETTWITAVGNQRFHVTAAPEVVDRLLAEHDVDAGIEEVVA